LAESTLARLAAKAGFGQVITGTSSGLGRRFADVLDAAGASVVLAPRSTMDDRRRRARVLAAAAHAIIALSAITGR
jgi:NADP-dependent 3-hydroxy acid dehydrogenase YdfG